MQTPTAILTRVQRALEQLIETADRYQGLFPSLLDRHSGDMLTELPAPILGQRNGDRSHLGCNLMHDQVTLRTLYALATACDQPAYAAAADRYLARFASHCTDTATGLFPWGEHSFWHLLEDRVGNSYFYHDGRTTPAIHDHLRQAPLWLWEKLQVLNPDCVARFAEGLEFHWSEGKQDEYFRHACIEQREYLKADIRSCDFPRHSGFYLVDWVFAWKHTGRQDFLEQIHTMLDYWWEKRDERGLLLIESRAPQDALRFYDTNAPGQTLSLAASLLESAELITAEAPELAATMRRRAAVYIDGFLAAPHDLEAGIFVSLSSRSDNSLTEAMPVWGSKYGLWPASYVALISLCAYRLTGDGRLLDWAKAVGACYAGEPFPSEVAVPAMDAGLGLGLLADLFTITGDEAWLSSARKLSDRLVTTYLDALLPRGAAGIDWYESQMGPGFVLHGLARTALLAQDPDACPLEADYTAR